MNSVLTKWRRRINLNRQLIKDSLLKHLTALMTINGLVRS